MKVMRSSDFQPAKKITYQEICEYMKHLGMVDSLMSTQRLSTLMSNQAWVNLNLKFDFRVAPPVEGKILLSRDFISFFAKHLVLLANGKGSYNDADIVKFIYDYNNVETDLDSLKPENPDSWIWVLRATNHQWFYLRLPSSIIGRYHYIFSKLFSAKDFKEKVDAVLGIDVFDLTKIGFCIMANYCFREDGNYADSFLMSSYINTTIEELKPLLSEENLLTFMGHFSTDRKGFQEKSKEYELDDPKLKRYEFNLLRRYPVIKTDSKEENKKYIIPSLQDFIYAFSEGLYYLILDTFTEASDKNTLFQKMGSVFESYIGDFLRYYEIPEALEATLLDEQTYNTPAGEVKSADWIIHSDNTIYQIECKKRKPSNYARAGVAGEDGSGVDELLTDIAQQLDKLVTKKEHIENNLVQNVAYNNQNFVNILVYLDEMFSIGSYGFDTIKEKMTKEVPPNTYVLGSYEFELACQHMRNSGKNLKDSIDDVRTNNLEEIFHIDFLSDEYDKFHESLGVRPR